MTGSSGPGIALKSEAISLAFMLELPMIIINVQRGGPSTGLPTKPEQSDLLFSLYGRHGESPLPVLAIASPSDAFLMAIEAARIAVKYMTPVILLSDNHVANGSEPWKLPDVDQIPDFPVKFQAETEGFQPYLRDEETLSRPWAKPGTPGLEHRIGGIERRVHPIEWAAKQSLEGAETRVMKVLEKLESGEWRDRDPLVSPASKRRE